MAIDVTFPTINFPHRGEFERSAFVTAQETAQDTLAGSFTTAIEEFKTQANELETNVNNKEANVVEKHDIVVEKEALMNPHYENIDICAENIGSIGEKLNKSTYDTHISVPASYHLLQGNLAVDNYVTTQGFNTTLYTGNGSTQSINTGIDMDTQWGNDASEKFGGLVWIKSRGAGTSPYTGHNYLIDTVRTATRTIMTNGTNADFPDVNGLTSFTSSGFNVGNANQVNYGTAPYNTYASWNFQTTHRISGTTNHGKAYTCHFNPFTGFTMVKYEGSGIAGHEIPHHLGRKLGFVTTKNLIDAGTNWHVGYDGIPTGQSLILNGTNALFTSLGVSSSNDTNVVLPSAVEINSASKQWVMYGWANSYFDEANKLIGNYEIGVYQATGNAGFKVNTRGKPAWLLRKAISATGSWSIVDNKRVNSSLDGTLWANLSDSEIITTDIVTFVEDGFIINVAGGEVNTAGGQYLYMVVYDTNSNGGGSYYPRATDTSNLQIQNAIIPFANGIDANGTKITTLSKNETISGLTLTAGKNYVYAKNDGTYGVSKYAPCYGLVPTRTKAGETPDFFDIAKNKWFTTTGGSELVTNGTFDSNINGWTGVGATISQSNGTIIVQNTASYGRAYTAVITTIGKKYTIVVSGNGDSDSSLVVEINTSIPISGQSNSNNGSVQVSIGASFGSVSYTFVAQNTMSYISIAPTGPSNTGFAQVDNISVFEAEPTIGTEILESRNYLNHIVYADNDGSPLYVEELPKVEYKDSLNLQSLTYKGNEVGGFLGVGQTWQNVTASRVSGVTYTNSTGKPIMVSVYSMYKTGENALYSYINGEVVLYDYINTSSPTRTVGVLIVPNGSTYRVDYSAGTWFELR